VATLGAETSPVEEPLDEGDSSLPGGVQDLDLDGFPTVKRLQPLLSENHTQEEFEQSLEAMLDRIDLDLSQ
jgi:TetR/AcrR family transcriptional regulator, tetracycline repressor protein